MADRWFERHGEATVFFTRMLPIVRTFVSLPAGVARMPFWRFSLFTVLGCLPWVFGLTLIGQQVGDALGGLEGPACTTSTTPWPSRSWRSSSTSS